MPYLKHITRIMSVAVYLGLIGALALVVVVRAKAPSTATTTPSKMQTAAFTAIADSPISKGHTTIWLIAPNGSVKLLQRSSASSSIARSSSSTSTGTFGVLCKGDAFASGTLQSGYAEEAVFKVPSGTSALVGAFSGNSGNGDKSYDLVKGLQYKAGYDAVSIANPFTNAVPFTGYFNLLFSATKTC